MKVRFTIARKISASLITILLLFAVTAVTSIIVLQRNINDDIANVYQPSLDDIKELSLRVSETEEYSNSWIYQPNDAEKNELRQLQDKTIPDVVSALALLTPRWTNQMEADTLRDLTQKIDRMILSQKIVMQSLSSTGDYDSSANIEKAIEAFESHILPASKSIAGSLQLLIGSVNIQIKELAENKVSALNKLRNLTILLGLTGLVIGIIASTYLTRSITNPIVELKEKLRQLSQGEIPKLNIKKSEDEIGEMVEGMKGYINALENTSVFAGQIGKGEFEADYKALSEKDILGNSLLFMRDNLRKSAEEERKRNWANQGVAEIGTILRHQGSTAEEVYMNIIRFVVKYTRCNQGSLFLLNDDSSTEQYLQLAACYAWDKRKHIAKRIEVGDGLVGQCALEKETILMTNIPKDYISITSGLGEALPSSLIIVPLKANDEIHGIMEIATFNKFENYEIEFIERLAENIASTISTVRVNERTRLLLAQSQQQAEEMRSQEEEMRQNMEELSATQEEMGRKEKEYLKKIDELEMQVSLIET